MNQIEIAWGSLEMVPVATGYPADRPAWLTVWLLIIADNFLHVLCNGLAIAYL